MPQIDTRFPDWMVRKNWTTSDAVNQTTLAGAQIMQRNREFAAMQEFRASQLRTQDAYRQAQINTQLMKQRQIEAEQTDAALVTQWMQDPRKPPPTGLRTPKGLSAVAQVQKVFAATETGNHFAAVNKGYTDKIKELPAVATLQVQQLLDASDGKITPEIAALIDTETAKRGLAKAQILNEMGEPYVKGGEGRPAFIQSLETGGIQRLPQDWSGDAQPLTDVDNNIIGYGIRTPSGGFRLLPEHKPPPMEPARRAAMNLKMKTVQMWWDGLDKREKSKPENQALLRQKITDVEGEFTTQPAAAPTVADPKDPLGLFK